MNYEDESYVRLYTRDTASWKMLGWEAQTVLLHMLRDRFDRAGVFDCQGHEVSQAVTAVTGLPREIVSVGLKCLLATKTWVVKDGRLVWPTFLEAQTCKRGDRTRQRESRRNRRAKTLTVDVTPVELESRPVTDGHTRSPEVTPSQAKPSREEDPPTPFQDEPQSESRLRPADPMGDTFTGRSPERRADVAKVHEAWKRSCNFPKHKFRQPFDVDARAIAQAIDSDGLENCLIVAEYAPNDGMVNGKLDEQRQAHDRPEYIFGKSHVFHRILKAALAAGKGTDAKKKLSASEAVAAAKGA